MNGWYSWIVVVHVIGAFGFILAHGVSAFVAFRLRRERRPDHVVALLELSSAGLTVMYPALLLLLVGGIAAGFGGDWWGELWIWVSIALLLGIAVAMYLVGTTYYIRVRHAVGKTAPQDPKAFTPTVASAEELDRLLTSSRPYLLAGIGGGGLAVIVWLMEVKPF